MAGQINVELLKRLKGKAPELKGKRPGVEVEIGIGGGKKPGAPRPFGGKETPEEEALEGHEMPEGALPPGMTAGAADAEEMDLSGIPDDVLEKEMERRRMAMGEEEGEPEAYDFPEEEDEEAMA